MAVMENISYRRHRFHSYIIKRAVWLYYRFTISYRDVEELLAERGIDVSYETVRRWAQKFGREYGRRIGRRRGPAFDTWHLDEVFENIGGQQMYLWRAVDGEGEVLDIVVQKHRNKRAALKLLQKLPRKQGVRPTRVVTDKLKSYGAAFCEMGLGSLHETGHRLNNRAESSHVPIRRRERKMQHFKSQKSA
jgi:putative transposase